MKEKVLSNYLGGNLNEIISQKFVLGRSSQEILASIYDVLKLNGSNLEYNLEEIIKKKVIGKLKAYNLVEELVKLIVLKHSNIEKNVKFGEQSNQVKNLLFIYKELLDIDGLKKMEFIFIGLGFFDLGFYCRTICEELIINLFNKNKSMSSTKLHSVYWALKNRYDIDTANKYYYSKIQFLSFFNRNEYLIFSNIMKSDKDQSYSIAKTKFNTLDLKYNQVINNKKIAIIGPANGNVNVEEVLKEYDVIISITYRGTSLFNEEPMKGKRYISYYNYEASTKIEKEIDKSFFEHLDFSVFKTIDYDYQRKLVKQSSARKIFSLDNKLFLGQPNMLQMIIYDLLHFNPKEIKIFNFNFFLSHNLYRKDYKIEGTEHDNRFKLWNSFAIHNIISQFQFAKALYNNGLYLADDDGKNVLDLDIDEYISQMEKIHGT
ncbi:hypothetical protein [Globicatella sulfidifaciens]|uniref:Uncharacterized protein n=1 Tax=Globicatella sulfidifaciens TaxID=136093 RepID=A0A7X8GZT0_9LACT|nr:hypothetical protein [Globicatella sulfidifaciens]NLJ17771.1 hypothetical protein [Globicatella sulfidifaciens]